MTRLKNAKAFTLIELIVVIVIIGILVAIAAVAYNSIITNSKKSAAEFSASQVAKIIQAKAATAQIPTDTVVLPTAAELAADGVKNTVVNADTTVGFDVVKDGFTVKYKFDGDGDTKVTVGETPSKVSTTP